MTHPGGNTAAPNDSFIPGAMAAQDRMHIAMQDAATDVLSMYRADPKVAAHYHQPSHNPVSGLFTPAMRNNGSSSSAMARRALTPNPSHEQHALSAARAAADPARSGLLTASPVTMLPAISRTFHNANGLGTPPLPSVATRATATAQKAKMHQKIFVAAAETPSEFVRLAASSPAGRDVALGDHIAANRWTDGNYDASAIVSRVLGSLSTHSSLLPGAAKTSAALASSANALALSGGAALGGSVGAGLGLSTNGRTEDAVTAAARLSERMREFHMNALRRARMESAAERPQRAAVELTDILNTMFHNAPPEQTKLCVERAVYGVASPAVAAAAQRAREAVLSGDAAANLSVDVVKEARTQVLMDPSSNSATAKFFTRRGSGDGTANPSGRLAEPADAATAAAGGTFLTLPTAGVTSASHATPGGMTSAAAGAAANLYVPTAQDLLDLIYLEREATRVEEDAAAIVNAGFGSLANASKDQQNGGANLGQFLPGGGGVDTTNSPSRFSPGRRPGGKKKKGGKGEYSDKHSQNFEDYATRQIRWLLREYSASQAHVDQLQKQYELSLMEVARMDITAREAEQRAFVAVENERMMQGQLNDEKARSVAQNKLLLRRVWGLQERVLMLTQGRALRSLQHTASDPRGVTAHGGGEPGRIAAGDPTIEGAPCTSDPLISRRDPSAEFLEHLMNGPGRATDASTHDRIRRQAHARQQKLMPTPMAARGVGASSGANPNGPAAVGSQSLPPPTRAVVTGGSRQPLGMRAKSSAAAPSHSGTASLTASQAAAGVVSSPNRGRTDGVAGPTLVSPAVDGTVTASKAFPFVVYPRESAVEESLAVYFAEMEKLEGVRKARREQRREKQRQEALASAQRMAEGDGKFFAALALQEDGSTEVGGAGALTMAQMEALDFADFESDIDDQRAGGTANGGRGNSRPASRATSRGASLGTAGTVTPAATNIALPGSGLTTDASVARAPGSHFFRATEDAEERTRRFLSRVRLLEHMAILRDNVDELRRANQDLRETLVIRDAELAKTVADAQRDAIAHKLQMESMEQTVKSAQLEVKAVTTQMMRERDVAVAEMRVYQSATREMQACMDRATERFVELEKLVAEKGVALATRAGAVFTNVCSQSAAAANAHVTSSGAPGSAAPTALPDSATAGPLDAAASGAALAAGATLTDADLAPNQAVPNAVRDVLLSDLQRFLRRIGRYALAWREPANQAERVAAPAPADTTGRGGAGAARGRGQAAGRGGATPAAATTGVGATPGGAELESFISDDVKWWRTVARRLQDDRYHYATEAANRRDAKSLSRSTGPPGARTDDRHDGGGHRGSSGGSRHHHRSNDRREESHRHGRRDHRHERRHRHRDGDNSGKPARAHSPYDFLLVGAEAAGGAAAATAGDVDIVGTRMSTPGSRAPSRGRVGGGADHHPRPRGAGRVGRPSGASSPTAADDGIVHSDDDTHRAPGATNQHHRGNHAASSNHRSSSRHRRSSSRRRAPSVSVSTTSASTETELASSSTGNGRTAGRSHRRRDSHRRHARGRAYSNRRHHRQSADSYDSDSGSVSSYSSSYSASSRSSSASARGHRGHRRRSDGRPRASGEKVRAVSTAADPHKSATTRGGAAPSAAAATAAATAARRVERKRRNSDGAEPFVEPAAGGSKPYQSRHVRGRWNRATQCTLLTQDQIDHAIDDAVAIAQYRVDAGADANVDAAVAAARRGAAGVLTDTKDELGRRIAYLQRKLEAANRKADREAAGADGKDDAEPFGESGPAVKGPGRNAAGATARINGRNTTGTRSGSTKPVVASVGGAAARRPTVDRSSSAVGTSATHASGANATATHGPSASNGRRGTATGEGDGDTATADSRRDHHDRNGSREASQDQDGTSNGSAGTSDSARQSRPLLRLESSMMDGGFTLTPIVRSKWRRVANVVLGAARFMVGPHQNDDRRPSAADMENLERAHVSVQQQLDMLNVQLRIQNDTIAELRDQLNAAKDGRDTAAEALEAATKKAEALEAEKEVFEGRRADLERVAAQMTDQLQQADREAVETEQSRAAETQKLQSEIKFLNSEIRSLQSSEIALKLKVKERAYITGADHLLNSVTQMRRALMCCQCDNIVKRATIVLPCAHIFCEACLTEYHQKEYGVYIAATPEGQFLPVALTSATEPLAGTSACVAPSMSGADPATSEAPPSPVHDARVPTSTPSGRPPRARDLLSTTTITTTGGGDASMTAASDTTNGGGRPLSTLSRLGHGRTETSMLRHVSSKTTEAPSVSRTTATPTPGRNSSTAANALNMAYGSGSIQDPLRPIRDVTSSVIEQGERVRTLMQNLDASHDPTSMRQRQQTLMKVTVPAGSAVSIVRGAGGSTDGLNSSLSRGGDVDLSSTRNLSVTARTVLGAPVTVMQTTTQALLSATVQAMRAPAARPIDLANPCELLHCPECDRRVRRRDHLRPSVAGIVRLPSYDALTSLFDFANRAVAASRKSIVGTLLALTDADPKFSAADVMDIVAGDLTRRLGDPAVSGITEEQQRRAAEVLGEVSGHAKALRAQPGVAAAVGKQATAAVRALPASLHGTLRSRLLRAVECVDLEADAVAAGDFTALANGQGPIVGGALSVDSSAAAERLDSRAPHNAVPTDDSHHDSGKRTAPRGVVAPVDAVDTLEVSSRPTSGGPGRRPPSPLRRLNLVSPPVTATQQQQQQQQGGVAGDSAAGGATSAHSSSSSSRGVPGGSGRRYFAGAAEEGETEVEKNFQDRVAAAAAMAAISGGRPVGPTAARSGGNSAGGFTY